MFCGRSFGACGETRIDERAEPIGGARCNDFPSASDTWFEELRLLVSTVSVSRRLCLARALWTFSPDGSQLLVSGAVGAGGEDDDIER